MDVIVEDGKIVRYKIWDRTGKFDNDENLIGKFKTFKDNFKLDKKFIEKQFKDKLLSKSQIHNLRNFGGSDPIVQSKCYVNSSLQALHASATIRETVKYLNKFKNQPGIFDIKKVSPVMTNIFNAIENGGMERYVNGVDDNRHLKTYQKAMMDLASSLENSEAYYSALLDPNINLKDQKSLFSQYSMYRKNERYVAPPKEDCCDGKHQIRNGFQGTAIDIVAEIMDALATEAENVPQSELLMPLYQKKIQKRNGTMLFINRRHECLRYHVSLDAEAEKIDEFCPRSFAKPEYQSSLVRTNEAVTVKPQIVPVIIINRTFDPDEKPNLMYSKVSTYPEIEEIVYGKKHKYRLVASVDCPDKGHFVASVLTKDGWVRIDDIKPYNYKDLSTYDEAPEENSPWGAHIDT